MGLVAATVLIVAPLYAQQATTSPAGAAGPTSPDVSVNERGTVELHVQGADIRQVLQMLSKQSRTNIIATKEITGTVTADLYGVTFADALDAILKSAGFGYRRKGNFIYVYTAAQLEKIQEAGVLLVGGHSIEDEEIKYGLSVTGIVHPEKVWTKKGLKEGDRLILTKPLGTGIVNTAVKGEMADKELEAKSIKAMVTLNKRATEIMAEAEVHACTDITGFGLLGHLCEMVEENKTGMVVYSSSIPFFPEVKGLVEMGLVPAGLHRNREFRLSMLEISPNVPDWLIDVFFDPQTSGGLLFSLPSGQAEEFLRRLHLGGVEEAAIIGEVTEEPKGRIRII